MKKAQFDELEVGDVVYILRGYDKGRLCEILYIEGDRMLLRTLDKKPFKSTISHGNLRITNWRLIGKE